MKKVIYILAAALFLSGLTACRKSDGEVKADLPVISGTDETEPENTAYNIPQSSVLTVPVSTALSSLASDLEQCKEEEGNFLWNDCKAPHLPQTDRIYALKAEEKKAPETNREILEKFKEYCILYFGEYKEEKVYFRTWGGGFSTDEGDPYTEENGVKICSGLKLSDYYDRVINNGNNENIRLSFLEYADTENNRFMWFNTPFVFPSYVNSGAVRKASNADSVLNYDYPMDAWSKDGYEIMDSIVYDGSQKDLSYKLLDKETTLGEAVNYVENVYPRELSEKEEIGYKVHFTDIYRINDSSFAYMMKYSVSYKGIPFDYNEGIYSMTSMTGENMFMPEAYCMIAESDKADSFFGYVNGCDYEEAEEYTEICSLKTAADIAEKALSDNVKFKVLGLDLVYGGERTEDDIITLRPRYRFNLLNENSERTMYFYVDAVSGEYDYFYYEMSKRG